MRAKGVRRLKNSMSRKMSAASRAPPSEKEMPDFFRKLRRTAVPPTPPGEAAIPNSEAMAMARERR